MTCYSSDLRQKIVQVYLQGNTSIRAVAKQFVVSTSTVQRYLNQYRQTGELTPQKPGTNRKSVLSEHQADALAVVADHPDWTLWQYCEYLTEKLRVNVSTSMMDRFCKQHRLTLKKKSYRGEKVKTEEVQAERVQYQARIQSIDPKQLVFIDETAFWVGMERKLARSLAGEKAYSYRTFYKGRKTTLIGAIKQGEILTMQTLEGSMKGKDFYEFVKTKLIKTLRAGDVVVMDNLNSHHREDIKALIESVGARVDYLPVYSPEFNPIEMLWAKLKSIVRKFRTKTTEALDKLIEVAMSLVSTSELRNWFRKCIWCSE